MRSALIPVLMPTGLPRRGLVCYHDLYDPTSSLASVPDLSGNGYSLQLGSGAGADSNDPSWAAGGKGLSFVDDDYATAGGLEVHSLTWILVFKTDFDGDASFATLYRDSDTYVRLRKETATSLQVYAYGAGGAKSVLWPGGSWDESAIDVAVVTVPAGGDMTVTRMRDGSSKKNSGCLWDGTTATVYLGGQSAPYANDCYIYSSLLYNRVLSASEQQRAYKYLKTQWATRGVTIS